VEFIFPILPPIGLVVSRPAGIVVHHWDLAHAGFLFNKGDLPVISFMEGNKTIEKTSKLSSASKKGCTGS
jgi:hypothetical protein